MTPNPPPLKVAIAIAVPLLEAVFVVLLMLMLQGLAWSWLGFSTSGDIEPLQLLQVKLIEVPLALLVLIGLLRARGQGLAGIGLRRPAMGWSRAIMLGVAFTLPLLIVSIALALIGSVIFPGEQPQPFQLDSPWALPAFLAVGILAGGVVEEIQFRGFVFQRMEMFFSFGRRGSVSQRASLRAALLTSLVFAALHLYEGPAAALAIFAVALGLQGVYLYTGRNLIACMVCHGLFNCIQICLLMLQFG